MDSQNWLILLKRYRLLAVIRAPSLSSGLAMAQAAAAGGIRLIEITWDSAEPAALIGQLRSQLPACWVGAGTLLSPAEAEAAIAAGAQFGFSPYLNGQILALGQRQGVPMVAGALTPSEIAAAWQAGAAAVKVFPVAAVGGASYIQSLQGPLAGIPLIPTGGITLSAAADLVQAGAIAVGLASALFPKAQVQAQDWASISAGIEALVQSLAPNCQA